MVATHLSSATLRAPAEQARSRVGTGAAIPEDDGFGRGLVALAEPLRRRALRLTGNASQAEDLLQETLARAWSARISFKLGSNLQAWTYTILRNLHLTQVRRQRRFVELDDTVAEGLMAIDAGQYRHTEVRAVQEAIAQLPDDQRSALLVVAVEGLDYRSAATKLQITEAALKSRVNRARAALRQLVEYGRPASAEKTVAQTRMAKTLPQPRSALSMRGRWAAAKAQGRPLWIG